MPYKSMIVTRGKKEKKETEKLLIFNYNKLKTGKYKPQTNITFEPIKSKCLSKA